MRSEFEEDVRKALDGLPRTIQHKLENIAVVVEDLPSREVSQRMGLRSPYDLLGLYQGVSLDRRGFYYGNVLPDKITLYRRSIEAQCKSRRETVKRIKEIVIHEIGHYFGLDDKQLHELLSDGEGS